ncbi:MFS transporter [Galactobacter valiniphilus]|uniref:MFS transporter n=1 Tax=Galactobacter valiniphilus TaxID=2676122 RepID=A0A399JB04_9MICC|nr:MFS transporter [Galactobacter valiniphilus]RII42755.1 MFS transporter [Galactobacter valiniphilus]
MPRTPFAPKDTVPAPLSRRRAFISLFVLALGGFGIGCTEFASMGLLPNIAQDLLPGFEAHPEVSIAQAGQLISAYALGVVVGAPILATLTARASHTKLALWLLLFFVVGNLASALMPGFTSTLVARFVAGLPHGAYFGVASLLAARIMGPGKQGQGIALALSGLTVANVIGVPVVTLVGQAWGWRSAYMVVAAVFAVTLVAGLLVLPRYAGDPTRHPAKELRAFRGGQLWLMIAVACVGFGGFFAIYSYIAETATRVSGLTSSQLPWLLAVVGIGMTIGNVVGGRLSDLIPRPAMVGGFVVYMVSLAVFPLLAGGSVGVFVGAGLIGLTQASLTPAIQSRLIAASGDAALLGAASNHAAFNVGNSLGAALGGAVIAAGLGYLAPAWVGLALAGLGFALLLLSLGWERRRGSLLATA